MIICVERVVSIDRFPNTWLVTARRRTLTLVQQSCRVLLQSICTLSVTNMCPSIRLPMQTQQNLWNISGIKLESTGLHVTLLVKQLSSQVLMRGGVTVIDNAEIKAPVITNVHAFVSWTTVIAVISSWFQKLYISLHEQICRVIKARTQAHWEMNQYPTWCPWET